MDASNTNITLQSLYEMMNGVYRNSDSFFGSRDRADKLFSQHFTAAIKNTCPSLFNDNIVSLISSEAYDRGHSSGGQEIVCQAMSIAEFAKNILEASK